MKKVYHIIPLAGLLSILFLLTLLIALLLHLFIQSFPFFIFESLYGNDFLNALVANPLIAIIVGVLASVIVRSSSIVITILAAMVVAGFPVLEALYILFGANMGTTFQSSLIKIIPNCDVTDKRRMMTISSMHYFNNLLAFAIFFPLQLSFDFLGRSSQSVVEWLVHLQQLWIPHIDPFSTWDTPKLLQPLVEQLASTSYPIATLILLLLAITLLMRLFFITLRVIFDPWVIQILTRQIKQMQKEKIEKRMLLLGIYSSSLLQSSSSVMYILMPLMRQLDCGSRAFYPLILGINVGTCLTTILFALILQSKLALTIGLAHFLYNFFALLVFTYIPLLKELSILASKYLAFCSYEFDEQERKEQ